MILPWLEAPPDSLLRLSHPLAPTRLSVIPDIETTQAVDALAGGIGTGGPTATMLMTGPYGPVRVPKLNNLEFYDFGPYASNLTPSLPWSVAAIMHDTSGQEKHLLGVGRGGVSGFAFGTWHGVTFTDIQFIKYGAIAVVFDVQAAQIHHNPGDSFFAGVSCDSTGMRCFARNYASGLTATATNADTSNFSATAPFEMQIGCSRLNTGVTLGQWVGGIYWVWASGCAMSFDEFDALSVDPTAYYSTIRKPMVGYFPAPPVPPAGSDPPQPWTDWPARQPVFAGN